MVSSSAVLMGGRRDFQGRASRRHRAALFLCCCGVALLRVATSCFACSGVLFAPLWCGKLAGATRQRVCGPLQSRANQFAPLALAAAGSTYVEVRESTSPQDILGAAKVLQSCDLPTADTNELLELGQLFAGLGYMRLLSTVSLRSPLTAVAVTESGDIVGMVEVKSDGYVRNLAVDEEFRRQGIGKKLLLWCGARARERGAEQLWLHVESNNTAALDFYRNLSFEIGNELEPYGSQQAMGFCVQRRLKPLQ
mmetsp:Transcript_54244/g.100262  ORF Transcript_54244/g.100262 Transcript_54244/m.100262 type:complete len:252 (+) Transcript_54244:118-873(+)